MTCFYDDYGHLVSVTWKFLFSWLYQLLMGIRV